MSAKDKCVEAAKAVQARLDTGGELTWSEKEQVLSALKAAVEEASIVMDIKSDKAGK